MKGFDAVAALLGLSVLGMGALYATAWALSLSREVQAGSPFHSGWLPTEHAVSRYHVRWYTVTMLFLAFDMEMIFMYPWVRVISAVGTSAVVEMFTFLAVLLAGVAYAWREGALRWT